MVKVIALDRTWEDIVRDAVTQIRVAEQEIEQGTFFDSGKYARRLQTFFVRNEGRRVVDIESTPLEEAIYAILEDAAKQLKELQPNNISNKKLTYSDDGHRYEDISVVGRAVGDFLRERHLMQRQGYEASYLGDGFYAWVAEKFNRPSIDIAAIREDKVFWSCHRSVEAIKNVVERERDIGQRLALTPHQATARELGQHDRLRYEVEEHPLEELATAVQQQAPKGLPTRAKHPIAEIVAAGPGARRGAGQREIG